MARAKRDPEGRRRAIVEAAAELVLERGLPNVNHRRIAERAGVPLGATTQYFGSLDDLLVAALGELTTRYDEEVAALSVELGRTDDPARTIARYLRSYATDPERARAETAFFLANLESPAMRALTDDWYAAQARVLGAHFPERVAAAIGTYADGLGMLVARGQPIPSEDNLTWAIDRIIGIPS